MAFHHNTGIGWYSVSIISVMEGDGSFPLHSEELRRFKMSLKHIANWLIGLLEKQDSCLWPTEKCLSLSYQFPGALTMEAVSYTHLTLPTSDLV